MASLDRAAGLLLPSIVAWIGIVLALVGLVALYFSFWPAALIITGAGVAAIAVSSMGEEERDVFGASVAAAIALVGFAVAIAAALAVGFVAVVAGLELMRALKAN
jgi:hypothetical protein